AESPHPDSPRLLCRRASATRNNHHSWHHARVRRPSEKPSARVRAPLDLCSRRTQQPPRKLQNLFRKDACRRCRRGKSAPCHPVPNRSRHTACPRECCSGTPRRDARWEGNDPSFLAGASRLVKQSTSYALETPRTCLRSDPQVSSRGRTQNATHHSRCPPFWETTRRAHPGAALLQPRPRILGSCFWWARDRGWPWVCRLKAWNPPVQGRRSPVHMPTRRPRNRRNEESASSALPILPLFSMSSTERLSLFP